MPFSGGGGGQLTNHVHDNTPLQGGPLNFAGTTIASMNSGDMTYSDGAALQQLAIAAPNDQLRVSAGNIPEWFTPTGSSSTWETIADITLGAPGDIDSGIFGYYPVLAMYFSGSINTAGWSCSCKMNNTAAFGGLYNYTNTSTQAAATVYSTSTGSAFNWDYVGGGGSTDEQACFMTIYNPTTERKLCTWNSVQSRGGAIPFMNNGAGYYENSLTAIDQVEMCGNNGTVGATRQFSSGSRFILLGLVP